MILLAPSVLRGPLALSLCLLAALAAGCSEDDDGGGDPCERVVCQAGQDCVDGACVDRGTGGAGGGGGTGGEGGCATHADCAFDPAGAFCDPSSGACVGCLEDGQCRAGERCEAKRCQAPGCDADEACPAEAPRCRIETRTCVSCLADADCGDDERCSLDLCVPAEIPCDSDETCAAADPGRPLCLVSDGAGRCVGCRRDADCADAARCLAEACVSLVCAVDADCADVPGLGRCDPAQGLCVGCLGDTDCAAGEVCRDGGCGGAAPCASDADCPAARCDVTTGACVACLGHDDCVAGEICREGACGAADCVDTSNCPPGLRCESGSCVEPPACTADADCAADPRVPRCEAGSGRCVACLDGGDCAPGESCTASQCVRPTECANDGQCAAAYVCDRGVCSPCRTDDECPRGACVEGFCGPAASCTDDVACGVGVCAAGTCVACASDLDCRAGLLCDAGACREPSACATDADCDAGRTCQAGVCTSAGCMDDGAEPDDDAGHARPYAPGLPLSRTLCPNDEDFLAFAAAPGAGLDAALLAAPTGTALSLVYFDPATRALRELAAIEGRLLVAALPVAATGRYYLRVRAAAGVSGSYTVLAQVAPAGGGCDDPLEPNDSRNTARALGADATVEGLTLCGDDDFYAVAVPAGRRLSAYGFPQGGELRVELFTSAGARLGTGAATLHGPGGTLAVAGPAAAGGETYLVKVSAGATTPASYALHLATAEEAGCDAPTPLLAAGQARGRVSGTTLGLSATLDAGGCGAGGPDALYAVHLDAEARLSLALAADFDGRLSLRPAGCGAELSCAAVLAGFGALDVPRLPAGDYVVAVGGAPGAAGPFELAAVTSAPLDPPENDACADAFPLELSTGAAQAAGSTAAASVSVTPSCGRAGPDVVYAFSLATEARVVVDVAADADVTVAVVDAAACAVEAACAPAGRSVRLDEVLPAGDHALLVGSPSGAAASFTLQLLLPPPVTDDACADASVLAVPGSVSGDTTWARDELSFPLATSCTGYVLDGADVFHAVTLTAAQTLTATLTPAAGYDAALYVIDACAAPACLAGVDAAFAGGVETLSFTAPAAGDYVLVVDGARGGGGYTLAVQ